MLQLTLNLLTSICHTSKATMQSVHEGILAQIIQLSRSPLLQGASVCVCVRVCVCGGGACPLSSKVHVIERAQRSGEFSRCSCHVFLVDNAVSSHCRRSAICDHRVPAGAGGDRTQRTRLRRSPAGQYSFAPLSDPCRPPGVTRVVRKV